MTNIDYSRLRVVIPARYSSSRLPGKPLLDLGGEPMIVRVFERVSEALPSVEVVVATDDERIKEVLDIRDIPCLMTSADHESGTDRIEEVAARMGWDATDILINVQGDEPLVPIELLLAFAQFCAGDPRFEMGTISVPIDNRVHIHDPNVVKLTVDSNGRAITFSRSAVPYCRDVASDDWPLSAFLRHVGIYAYRRSTLGRITAEPACGLERLEKLEQLRALWLGIDIKVLAWDVGPPHGVDTQQDAERVAALFAAGA